MTGNWFAERNKGCAGKVAFTSKRRARGSARVMQQRGHTIVPYRCPWCRRFHLGHAPSPERLAEIEAAVAEQRETRAS